MLAMRTPCNSSSNFNCIDNVSKQRSDFEVTTISPAPRNRSRHVTSNKSTSDVVRKEGERCHCAFAKTYTKTFAGDDDMDPVNYKYTSRKNTHCQKTLVNYFCYGVDTIPSCFASQTRFCTSIQSKKFKWLSHVFITFILVFTLHSTSMPAFASSMSKSPLIRIDATERKNLFRTFTGQGPMERIVKPSKTHSDVPHDHAPRPTSILKKKPLDFQTLKVVERWGSDTTNVLLISGRDYIYMINATTDSLDDEIRYVQRLKWSSPPESMATCQLMGKQKHECNNFIRVVVLKGDQLYVCGTNSYDPRCRFYSRNDFASPPSITNGNTNFRNETACRGQCECPYNPAKASANLYTATANGFQLFSAVINDFMGKQPVLMRKNNPYVYSVERWFNDPTFIKMVESDDGKIYLFFREVATAVETGSSSPTTYARVAQVCKNDVGGSTVLRLQWTTFLKARLKCSISGSADGVGFDFNNLTSVSEITQILGQDGRPMNVVFATFTTPWEWSSVSMSAVCVYSIQTISNLFKLGNFFGEQELHSGAPHGGDAFDTTGIVETLVKAMPVPNYEVPVPRPGLCHDRSTTMSDKSLHFAEEHFLMYGPVMPLYQQPMFVGETDLRATQITVDTNPGYDDSSLVVYVGTEDGRILRLRPRLQIPSGPKSLLLEEIRVVKAETCSSGDLPCGVLALHVSRPNSSSQTNGISNPSPSLFVAFTDRVIQIPLSGCKQYASPECCNVDPDCGWKIDQCFDRTEQNRGSLQAMARMSVLPSNCQIKPEPKRCKASPSRSSVKCKRSCETPPPTHGCLPKKNEKAASRLLDESKILHTAFSVDQTISDQGDETAADSPFTSGGLMSTITPTTSPKNSLSDVTLSNLLLERVLPTVSEEYRTISSALEPEQRSALLEQLQEALVMTTDLVLRNHKQEYCLLTSSVNSLAHTYPILLREIETWHSMAMNVMNKNGFKRSCWDENHTHPRCSTKVTFNVSFFPTLWDPLEELLKEFEAVCITPPSSTSPQGKSATAGCDSLPGVLACRDGSNADNRLCHSKKCYFKYAVDAKALFRHVNDSRRFLASGKGLEPLWKPVNHSLTPTEAIKGHLELLVDDNPDPDLAQHFELEYYPITENLKITFYYIPVRDCSLNERTCIDSDHGCNPRLESVLSSYFNITMAKGLKPIKKKCPGQIQKSRAESHTPREGRSLLRRFPRSHHYETDNEVHQRTPSRCRYVALKAPKPDSSVWDQLVQRAQRSGGYFSSSDTYETVRFYSLEDVKLFFGNYCSGQERDDLHESFRKVAMMKKKKKKKKRRVTVESFVSREMPFVIEKPSVSRKVILKFFTNIVK